jgi:KaiC/GvpD/RAD55 family RecA-like ATPase
MGFFNLFKRKKKEKVIVQERSKEINQNNNKHHQKKPEKKEKIDPVLWKKIQKEEMKIANKIAREQLKDEKKQNLKSQVNPKDRDDNEVLKLNITGLDVLLKNGGIPKGASVLIEGGPGSGKTIFCLHAAMDMCRQGKKVLYMSFEEPEHRLIHHLEAFNFNAKKYVENGQLKIMRFSALDIARSVEALLSEAKKELLIDVQPILIPEDIEPDLVLVDSLTSIASAFSGEESRFRIYMEQLFKYLEEHKMTSLLIREVANPGHVGGGRAGQDEATSFLSDGIIIFYNVVFNTGKRTRAIEVLKLRGQDFERRIVEAEILNKKGLQIYPHKPLKGNYTLT